RRVVFYYHTVRGEVNRRRVDTAHLHQLSWEPTWPGGVERRRLVPLIGLRLLWQFPAVRRKIAVVLGHLAQSPFLAPAPPSIRPARVVPVGAFPGGTSALEQRLGLGTAPVVAWTRGPPLDLWRSLYRQAETVVVCPAAPRGQLLQAACLAGVLRAPLFVRHGGT